MKWFLISVHIIVISAFFSSRVSAQNPLLKIVSPTDGQTILGDKITVSFVVGNLIVGSEGHLHLWFDNPLHEVSNATEITTHFDYVLEGVSPGVHTLNLEVVKPDHTSFNPAISETTRFNTQLSQTTTPSEFDKPQNNLLLENIWPALGAVLGLFIIIIGFIIKKRIIYFNNG